MTILSLETLRQQITQQESQLQALRRELKARQARLASLTSRKKGLQAQLQEVEREIAALARGAKAATQVAAPKPAKAKPAQHPAGKKHTVSLAKLIVTILREAGQPSTVRELAAEAKRRGFRSTSRNFNKRVQNRVYELKKRRIVAPASGQPGYVLRGTPARMRLKPSPAKTGKPRAQPTLREVLTQILQRSPKPLGARELAEAALKAGYRTTSKNLINAVWVTTGRMNNLEHVPGKGYRLRKG